MNPPKKRDRIKGDERNELNSVSRKHNISNARSVFCYWCVRELGESMTSMAKMLVRYYQARYRLCGGQGRDNGKSQ